MRTAHLVVVGVVDGLVGVALGEFLAGPLAVYVIVGPCELGEMGGFVDQSSGL